MVPTNNIQQRVIWQRVDVMGMVRLGLLALLACLVLGSLNSDARAEVFQTPAGRTASATVTLHLYVQPKIVMDTPKNVRAEIRPVENPPKNMQIYYQYKPLNKGATVQADKSTGHFNAKGKNALQVWLNPLRSGKGNTLQSITKEINSKNARNTAKKQDDFSGTVELSTVFL